MVLNLFAMILVLGGAFLNSLWGLYSGMVNLFCSVIALAVSFGYWEAVDGLFASYGLNPSYTGPLSLGLLFIVTLAVLRFSADNLLRGNVHMPQYVDWVGGGVCGFLYAQIIVGVMVLSFLMLPWGGRVLMFSRYDRNTDGLTDASGRVQFERHSLWFHSDRLVLGLVKAMSGGSLRGDTAFGSVYPDFSEWVFWTGNAVQQESLTAPLRDKDSDGWYEKGLRVDSWWEQKQPLPPDVVRYRKDVPAKDKPEPPYEPITYKVADGKRLIGMRLALDTSSADRAKLVGTHRFRPTNFRVVGDIVSPDGMKTPREYTIQLLGGVDRHIDTNLRAVDMDNNFTFSNPAGKIDAYFEVDDGFVPRFAEYRRRARAAVPPKPAENPPAMTLTSTPPTDPSKAGAPGGGTVRNTGTGRFIDVLIRSNTGDNDRLPFKLSLSKISTNPDVELRDNQLVSIQAKSIVRGFKSDLEAAGPGAPVEKFKVPDGKRIFQIQAKAKHAQSIAGQVFNFAGAVANQYRAVDANGNTYDLAGYYALVKREGQDYIELFFAPNPGEVGFNGMLDVSQETRTALRQQDDAILGLIYVVPKGACITSIQSQGGKSEFGDPICVGK